MLKHLILPAIALVLSLSTHAQLRAGLALDYEHIQAPAYYNVGPGSGMGGSIFLRLPFSNKLGLDCSLDLAGGHTTYEFDPYSPYPNYPVSRVAAKRSFFYTGIPVYFVYSLSFQHVRVFVGAGPSLSLLSMGDAFGHGWSLGPKCNTITASFKAGFQLYKHVMFSGEFRPWSTVLNKTDAYQYNGYKISNLLSVKLGYEFGAIRSTKHSSRVHTHK
jgi:hypothetical protein